MTALKECHCVSSSLTVRSRKRIKVAAEFKGLIFTFVSDEKRSELNVLWVFFFICVLLSQDTHLWQGVSVMYLVICIKISWELKLPNKAMKEHNNLHVCPLGCCCSNEWSMSLQCRAECFFCFLFFNSPRVIIHSYSTKGTNRTTQFFLLRLVRAAVFR